MIGSGALYSQFNRSPRERSAEKPRSSSKKRRLSTCQLKKKVPSTSADELSDFVAINHCSIAEQPATIVDLKVIGH